MDAEILIFMSTKDQAHFLEVAGKYCDFIVDEPRAKFLVFKIE